jgi:hypothetical protein
MSKSQISFFNNTGLKTWEIIGVSEKYYELKTFGEEPMYLNIEKETVDEGKLSHFINDYTNIKTTVSIFNERGVTTYLNEDLIPTITKGRDDGQKSFTGNLLFISMDITNQEIAKVITDKGCSIIDHQIVELEGVRVLNVIALFKEKDKPENRMLISLLQENCKKLHEYSFRFKGKRMMHLYRNIVTRKKEYIISETNIRLRKPTPKNMSYNIITTKNQVQSVKRTNNRPVKIYSVKNMKDVKFVLSQKLKSITVYDPKGEINQSMIDMLCESMDNVYIFESSMKKVIKL